MVLLVSTRQCKVQRRPALVSHLRRALQPLVCVAFQAVPETQTASGAQIAREGCTLYGDDIALVLLCSAHNGRVSGFKPGKDARGSAG